MLQLDLQSRQPIYEQLILRLTELISLGVQKAYQELERRGITYSVSGRGSFVAPGEGAREILSRQSVEKIRDAVSEGKRTGLTRPQVDEVVSSVYSEEVSV